jgi:bifunctional N-acetylglucosamine-1-phosphate-uridyltransferase/glucosamine-1-phosphate-acetyltransferase GlmU-like protein
VVTQTVPPDALAIGRGRQENKPDWAKKRRKLAKTVEALKSGD